MILGSSHLEQLEKIANDLDKTGHSDKIKIAKSIDEVLAMQLALVKFADIIHPKLMRWLNDNHPRALINGTEAEAAKAELSRMGSSVVSGVDISAVRTLIKELNKVISGDESPEAGKYEINTNDYTSRKVSQLKP